MTGYGKGEATGNQFTITAEIKTVNNRFRDFRFKMGSLFNSKEFELKKMIENEFKRGTFDVSINYRKNESVASFSNIDEKKINEYLQKIIPILKTKDLAIDVRPVDFLRPEFFLERDEEIEKELYDLLNKSFKQAIGELKKARHTEGTKLKEVILKSLDEYERHYQQITVHKNSYQDMVREKLQKKFKDEFTEAKIDEGRFLQEVIYYLEKLDIDEEISRIHIHLLKFKKMLAEGGELGKQMDFVLQELGRETNTIGSKSAKNEISESVVQMKVQLEKIREQSLNIE
jgi:uncharacterized protein (TIGR00255 family)